MHFGKAHLSLLVPTPFPCSTGVKQKGWQGANGLKTATVGCIHPFFFDCVHLFCIPLLIYSVTFLSYCKVALIVPSDPCFPCSNFSCFWPMPVYVTHSFCTWLWFTLPACALTPALTSMIPGLPSINFTQILHTYFIYAEESISTFLWKCLAALWYIMSNSLKTCVGRIPLWVSSSEEAMRKGRTN